MKDGYATVLTKAAVLLGGVPRLAQRLNVATEELLQWIGDPGTAPDDVLANAAMVVRACEIDQTGTALLHLEALRTHRKRPL